MKFSEKIIQARKAKALTQEDLAEAVGVSRQAVSKWETGEANPDLDKLVSLCKVLDLSMDYLCLDKQPEVTAEAPQPPKSKSGRYLITGVCIGLVAAGLACLLAFGLREKPNDPTLPEPETTPAQTTTTQPTEPDYSDMLLELKTADARLESVGWHVSRVTFVPSVQVPGMQVQIAVRNHKTGKTEYLDTIKQGASYIADCEIPTTAYDLDFIAVCSVGEITVQFSLFNVESLDGSASHTKALWKTE